MGVWGSFKHNRCNDDYETDDFEHAIRLLLRNNPPVNLSYGPPIASIMQVPIRHHLHNQPRSYFSLLPEVDIVHRIFSHLKIHEKIRASGACRLFYRAILDDDERTHFLHQTGDSFGACPADVVDLYYAHHEYLLHPAYALQHERTNPEPLTRLTSRRGFALAAVVYFRWYGPLPKSPNWPPKDVRSGSDAQRPNVLRRRGGAVTVYKTFACIYEVTETFEDVLPLLDAYQQMHDRRDRSRVDADWDELESGDESESNDRSQYEGGDDEEPGFSQYTLLPSAYRGDPFEFLQVEYENWISMTCRISRAHAAYLVAIFDRNLPAWMTVSHGMWEVLPSYITNMIENLRGILSSEEDPRIEYEVS